MMNLISFEGSEAIIEVDGRKFGIPKMVYDQIISDGTSEAVNVTVSQKGSVKLNLPITYKEYIDIPFGEIKCTKPLSITKDRKKEMYVPSSNKENIKESKGVKEIMKNTMNFKDGDLICMVSTPRKDGEYGEKFRKLVFEKITSKMINYTFKDKEEILKKFETDILPTLEGNWTVEPTKDEVGYLAIQKFSFINKKGEEREGKNLVFLNPIIYDTSKANKKHNK